MATSCFNHILEFVVSLTWLISLSSKYPANQCPSSIKRQPSASNIPRWQHKSAYCSWSTHNSEWTEFNALQWSPYSPDLNPIEKLWDELGRQIYIHFYVNNIHDLCHALTVQWENIPQDYIYLNLRWWIQSKVGAEGGHTWCWVIVQYKKTSWLKKVHRRLWKKKSMHFVFLIMKMIFMY